jgi:hypothetical protein
MSFPDYVDTVCTYDARDALFRTPRVGSRTLRESLVMPKPPRLNPDEQRVSGQLPPQKRINETYFGTILGGKRMVPDNPQTNSNVDTVIWGRDIDETYKRGNWMDSDLFHNAAGMPTSDLVLLPPVCNRTYGECVPENDSGFPCSSTSYSRHAFSAVR